MTQVLITDSGGTPKEWVEFDVAACYYARKKVLWTTGDTIKTFRGGHNDRGELSTIDIAPIIGVTGPIFGREFYMRETVYADSRTLFARDRYMCAYCGDVMTLNRQVTVDHVIPKSRKGKNTWVNCVTACKPCNTRKGARTPEEARMPLLYVPYAPNQFEKIILQSKKILVCQMDFLIGKLPKNSRLQRQDWLQ